MKPILYNTEMVRAILSGQKTVTRRLVKPQFEGIRTDGITEDKWDLFVSPKTGWIYYGDLMRQLTVLNKPVKSQYRPGDILYVRETWGEDKNAFIYKADFSDADLKKIACVTKWRPSIHMPKEAARIFLKVTDVRVERLFDSFFKPRATIFNLRAEGINTPEVCAECVETYGYPCCNDEDAEGSECGNLDGVRDEFAKLWNSIIKPADLDRYGWAANPWVWVIEFKRCDKPEESNNG